MIIPYQIYRHFKGGLFLVLSIALSEEGQIPTVVYMSLNGDGKVWTRSQTDFTSLVPEGRDNPTGQRNRFELVKDINSVLSNCTTKNLIKELKSRTDNPFNEIDFEGLNDKVVAREYVLGELTPNVTKGEDYFLHSLYSDDSLEKVQSYAERHFDRLSKRVKIFKSVLVEVQSFD